MQAASASQELTLLIHRAAQLVKHYTAEVHSMAMNLSLRAFQPSAFPQESLKYFNKEAIVSLSHTAILQ